MANDQSGDCGLTILLAESKNLDRSGGFRRYVEMPSPVAPLLALILSSLGGGLTLCAQSQAPLPDWHQFRGPGGDGIVGESPMPVRWSNSENVRWKTALHGRAWSSPVVSQGRIYLTNAVRHEEGLPENHRVILSVLCLDGESGGKLWEKSIFEVTNPAGLGFHKKNSDASPSPLIVDGRIYAHFGHMGTVCLDLEGTEIWKSTELKYRPVHGAGGTPLLVGDHLIFSIDEEKSGAVVALNKHDGKLVWKSPRELASKRTFSFSTPTLWNDGKRDLVISPGSDVLSAVDPVTGKSVWHYRFDGFSVVPKPSIAHGLIYFSTGYPKASVHAIRPKGEGDVTEQSQVWTLQRGAPLTPSMLILGERLYMSADNGMLSCVNALTGEIIWQERVGRATSSSLVYANGHVYLQDELGVGHVIKHSDTFERVATNDLGEKTLSTYAVYGQDWIIRGEHHLYRIGKGYKPSN